MKRRKEEKNTRMKEICYIDTQFLSTFASLEFIMLVCQKEPLVCHTHRFFFFLVTGKVSYGVSVSKTFKNHFRRGCESQLLFVRNQKVRVSKFGEGCQWLEKYPRDDSETLL